MNRMRPFFSLSLRSLRYRSRFMRVLLSLLLTIGILLQVLFLTPSSLEVQSQRTSSTEFLDPELLLASQEIGTNPLAPGIPVDHIPDYRIEHFFYLASREGKKEWRMLADLAMLFHKEQIFHAHVVQAHLFDSQDQFIEIHGLEAKYLLNDQNLELYGNVETRFPDGFTLRSEYMLYLPKEKRVFIPIGKLVNGVGLAEGQRQVTFQSQGLKYDLVTLQMELLSDVQFHVQDETPASKKDKDKSKEKETASSQTASKNPETTIYSDTALIDRKNQQIYFDMLPQRPSQDRFVRVIQPDLFIKARKGSMAYRRLNEKPQLLTVHEDVYIREKTAIQHETRDATCGQADFDTQRNIMTLTKFPQVYQENDTLTGDIIRIFRNTDTVEVQHSNAFSKQVF